MSKRPNRTTIELPPPLREGLRSEAKRTGRKEAELIREALALWLEQRGVSLQSA
jgi:predicted DNA-binding protein